jgi:hypothetical protein
VCAYATNIGLSGPDSLRLSLQVIPMESLKVKGKAQKIYLPFSVNDRTDLGGKANQGH